jgi:ATP-dependent RNA helicase DDX19/DBP5
MTQQSKLLQQELDLAVSTKQYTRAAELQSEIEALASAQGEAARLEEEIKQAVMQKDYMRAATLQAQLDALETDDQGAAEAAAARAAEEAQAAAEAAAEEAARAAEITRLEQEIDEAVAATDYARAAHLQQQIAALGSTSAPAKEAAEQAAPDADKKVQEAEGWEKVTGPARDDGIDDGASNEEIASTVSGEEAADNTAHGFAADGGGGAGGGAAAAPPSEAHVRRQAQQAAYMDAATPAKDSALYSTSSFDELGLSPDLMRALQDKQFDTPSAIQGQALPMIIGQSRGLVAQARSGSGKTGAFALAMLSAVDPNGHYPQALCISPTLELADQNLKITAALGKYTTVKFLDATKANTSKGGPYTQQIVVGTAAGVLKAAKHFDMSKVKMFVLDEADELLKAGGHLTATEGLSRQLTSSCQKLLFSATFTQLKAALDFAGPNAQEIKEPSQVLQGIRQLYIRTDDKLATIASLFQVMEIGQSIVFAQSRRQCDAIAAMLGSRGFACTVLHSEIAGAHQGRLRVLETFRSGQSKVLIATNVLSRGIDVPAVSLVINYNMPLDYPAGHRGPPPTTADKDGYLQRIGRTGRFGRMGTSINLVGTTNSDADWRLMQQISTHYRLESTLAEVAAQTEEDLEELADMCAQGGH